MRSTSGPGDVGHRLAVICRTCAIVSGATFVVGLAVDARAAWMGWLLAFACFLGFSLTGPLFLAIHHLTDARWATPLRPIAEAMARTVPAAGVGGAGIVFGANALYAWANASAVRESPVLAHKASWLNLPFFGVRLLVFFAVWSWFARRLVTLTRALPEHPTRDERRAVLRTSAAFLAVFAVTLSLAAIDWFQSLEPEWFSTMYPLVVLSGMVTSGLAVVMIAAVAFRRGAARRGLITADTLDDLGKCAMALSLFWVYIAFCQYMLTWYTNLPVETTWYTLRHHGAWQTLSMVSVGLNWLIPFLFLMPKRARRNDEVIARVAIAMIVGRAVDAYVLLAPPWSPAGPNANPFVIITLVGGIAAFAWAIVRALSVRAQVIGVPDLLRPRVPGDSELRC